MSASGEHDFKMSQPRGEVKLWDVAEGKERASLGKQREEVWAVAFSPDGTVVSQAVEVPRYRTLGVHEQGSKELHLTAAARSVFQVQRLTGRRGR